MATKKLSDAALQVIQGLKVSTVDAGTLATINGHALPPDMLADPVKGLLTRDLYVEVDKALKALGGAWNRKLGGHLFPDNDTLDEALDSVIHTGTVVDTKKLFQFYETPPKLAYEMVKLADIEIGMRVLEPSAGKGRIVDAILAMRFDVHVVAVELAQEGIAHLAMKYVNDDVLIWRGGDFLKFSPATRFDRVLMNPPFTKQQDAKHVRHAYDLLKPGGRIVAIMAAGVKFRDTEHYRWVRDHAIEILDNPPDAFKESGTSVRTVTVVIDK